MHGRKILILGVYFKYVLKWYNGLGDAKAVGAVPQGVVGCAFMRTVGGESGAHECAPYSLLQLAGEACKITRPTG